MTASPHPPPLDTLAVRLETAAAHVVTNVPHARPDETVGAVRSAVLGQRFDSFDDIAVCEGERLVGLVTIEEFVAAGDDDLVADVMDTDPPVVHHGVDQELMAHRMIEHRETSVAVVDDDGAFLGLVPAQAMLSVLLDEHTEDLARLGGVLRTTEGARLSALEPLGRRLAHRLPWLALGLVGAMASASLVGSFEAALSTRVALAFFLPAIVYMADAVGTQTETLAVRGLSVGVPISALLTKELVTGSLIGIIIAVAFLPFALVGWGDAELAVVVSVSLLASCAVASVVALVLPWALDRVGRDPAFGSGPVATVIQDLLSILVYLTVATLVLGS